MAYRILEFLSFDGGEETELKGPVSNTSPKPRKDIRDASASDYQAMKTYFENQKVELLGESSYMDFYEFIHDT